MMGFRNICYFFTDVSYRTLLGELFYSFPAAEVGEHDGRKSLVKSWQYGLLFSVLSVANFCQEFSAALTKKFCY
jgi:hypothetical protein